jgi:anti-sigma B factor antagonist
MKIELRHENGIQIIALQGEIDMHSAAGLRERLLGALRHNQSVIIDMSAVKFVDSSGIAILVEGYKVAKNNAQGFALAGINPAPMQVMQLTRLDKVFPIFPDIASAIKAGESE